MSALEFLQVLHFIDDDSVEIDSRQVHVILEEEEIVQDRVFVAADHDEQLSPDILGEGEGVQVNRDSVGQVPSPLDEKDVPVVAHPADGLQHLLPGPFLIVHVAELGVVKPDTHVHRVFLQAEDGRNQGRVVVPQPFLPVEHPLAEGFDIGDLFLGRRRNPYNGAGLARAFTHRCDNDFIHLGSLLPTG